MNKTSDNKQLEKFKAAAKKISCDESKNALEKAIKGILDAGPVKDIPPPPRTKKNMNRKFRMKLDRKGMPVMEEVE